MSSELEILMGEALKARASSKDEIDWIFRSAWEAARGAVEKYGAGPSSSTAAYFAVMTALETAIVQVPIPSDDPLFEAVRQLDVKIEAERSTKRTRRLLMVPGSEDAENSALLTKRNEAVRKILHGRDKARKEVLAMIAEIAEMPA